MNSEAIAAAELASCTAVELFSCFGTSDSSLHLSFELVQKDTAESVKTGLGRI